MATPAAPLPPAQAEDLAREAYIFGFPLVSIEVQIDRSTAVTRPQGTLAPPCGSRR
jgi:hypothetical protein